MQPLQGEDFNDKTAKLETEATVAISDIGLWSRWQKSFFDIRMFNLLAQRYSWLSLEASRAMNERDKIRKYNERIINAEQGIFTLLSFHRCRRNGRAESDLP